MKHINIVINELWRSTLVNMAKCFEPFSFSRKKILKLIVLMDSLISLAKTLSEGQWKVGSNWSSSSLSGLASFYLKPYSMTYSQLAKKMPMQCLEKLSRVCLIKEFGGPKDSRTVMNTLAVKFVYLQNWYPSSSVSEVKPLPRYAEIARPKSQSLGSKVMRSPM